MEPGEIVILLGIISFPWVVKMIFGIIADNYTLFGSRRRAYLVLACVINVISMTLLIIYATKYGKYFITICMCLTQLCMTFCDAITDALVVQNSRLDPENGSEDLNSVTVMASAFGGIIGCGAAGFIELFEQGFTDGTQGKFIQSKVDPNIYFGIYTALILCLFVAVWRMHSSLEPEIV
jgi:MFS family permease